jgi:hypothetical protein
LGRRLLGLNKLHKRTLLGNAALTDVRTIAGPTITPAVRRALRFAPWIKLFGGVRLLQRNVRSLLLESSGDSTWVTDEVIAR